MDRPAAKRVFTRDELLAEPEYATRQSEAGYRLHGGFDAAGRYLPPRSAHRIAAIEAWAAGLAERGWPLVDASVGLLRRGNYPTAEQQHVLLDAGLGRTLWDALTITGVIEARGRALCDVEAPDFQEIVVEDIAQMSVGHLNRGLLYAHGLDEGGNPQAGEGGHDAMWFAVRDLLFGAGAFPDPVIPESLSKPETGRQMPGIPGAHEGWILLLMNVLMIEVRAEAFFAFCTGVMRDPRNFTDRRAAADHAADLVDRIRTDEALHVGYLQTFISELRSLTFRTEAGPVPGAALIDPVWASMVEWHGVTNFDHGRAQTRETTLVRIAEHADAPRIREAFLALEPQIAA